MPDSKLLKKLKNICDPGRWRAWVRECDRHRFMVSFWCSLSFIGLGSSLVVFGPTLLDLANHLSVGVGSLAIMFAVRALGGALGSVGSGAILDKAKKLSYTFMCFVIFTGIATTAALPLSVHIAMLGVIIFFNGVSMGALDNGTHAILMRMWGDKSGPCMQVLHFAFALGAFFAPLIAKPFISEIEEEDTDGNSTGLGNSTCSNILEQLDGSGSYNNSLDETIDCESLLETCSNLTHNYNLSVTTILTTINCSNETVPPTESSEEVFFGWAYWISASFFILPLLAYIYYAVTCELKRCFRKEKDDAVPSTPSHKETETPEEDKKVAMKQSLLYRVIIFTLLFLFMFFYVGLEVSYGSLIFTVAVKGELGFSKQKAALLTSVFWGTFAFTRLFSVTLALLKVPASYMMTGNITGSLIGSTVILIFPHDDVAIWIGSAILGTSFASIYPTTMTWLSEHTEVSGKAISILVTGGTLGDIALPPAVGALIAHISPDCLIYFTFAAVLVSAMFIAILFVTAHVQRKKSRAASMRYRKLDVDQSVENGDVDLSYTNDNEKDDIGDGDDIILLDNQETEI